MQANLTLVQERAIDLMLTGMKDRQIADEIGVGKSTVSVWRNHNDDFIALLAAKRQEIVRADMDRLRALLGDAIGVVADSLGSEDERLRLQAALALLKIMGVEKAKLLPDTTCQAQTQQSAPVISDIRTLLREAWGS